MPVAREVARLRLTDRDHAALAFAAEHRLILERQIERLLGAGHTELRDRLGHTEPRDRLGHTELRDRLQALARADYLRTGRVFDEPYVQIRARGLTVIDSKLPAPRFNLSAYKHDVGLGWLWLAAHEGAFGPLREVLSERRLRSHDGALERPAEPYGVRLGGHDRRGNERLHYPDLLLIDPHGRRLALELELTPKGRERRESILGGYGADARTDRVLYLVEDQPAGRAINRAFERTARELGVSDRVRFQIVKPFGLAVQERGQGPQRGAVGRRRTAGLRDPAEATR